MNAFRKKLDRIGLAFPIPDINPNVVSGSSVLISMLFLLFIHVNMLISFAFLILVLIFDWLDGLVAKKHRRESEEGYFVDVVCDRLSEGIIFSVFFLPWFFLFSLNCLLSIISVTKKCHIILPLRHIFVIFYAILLFFGPIGI